MNSIELGPGPEFDRIRAIAKALGPNATGLGDDCAFLPGGWCVSVDVSSEDVHFKRAWLAPREIGWRAAAAALSDLAAVGAVPVAVLVGLSAPQQDPPAFLAEVMAGVGDAGAAVGARVVGGDLTAGSSLSLAVTVLGQADRPIARVGASPGDGVWVTGTLGGARAALIAWRSGETPNPAARARFAMPTPRIRQGGWLATHGATAMIDLSDGLGGDAGHLASASRVRLSIELDQLPVDPGVTDSDPRLTAVQGGEDYELLVTLPASFNQMLAQRFVQETGVALTKIGEVGQGHGVTFTKGGAPIVVSGYDHFA